MEMMPLVPFKEILQKILHTGVARKHLARRFGELRGVVALDETFFEPSPEAELAGLG
jgi:hypothetical protein